MANIAQEIALLERQKKSAKSNREKVEIMRKVKQLKEELTKQQTQTALPAARKVVKQMPNESFKEFIARLKKKPEYSFLNSMGVGKIADDYRVVGKRVGWRVKGKNNYKVPSKKFRRENPDLVYYEDRKNRSDVYRPNRLEHGGNTDVKGLREGQVYDWMKGGVEHTIYIDKIEGNSILFRLDGKYQKYSRKNFNEFIEQIGATPSFMEKGGMMAKQNTLKEGDYVWNAVGKKLVVDKVTKGEYYLSVFGQFGASPFLKSKIHSYIKSGKWTLKPKMAKGGAVKKSTFVLIDESGKEIFRTTSLNKASDTRHLYPNSESIKIDKIEPDGSRRNLLANGGKLSDNYTDLLNQYNKIGAFLEDATSESERAKYKKQLDEIESKIHRHERNYEEGGMMAKGGVFSTYQIWHKPSNSVIVFDSKTNVVKQVREWGTNGMNGKVKNEVNIEGTIYRKPKMGTTYNSVMENKVLAKENFNQSEFQKSKFASGGTVLSNAKKKVAKMTDDEVVKEISLIYHYDMADNNEDMEELYNDVDTARKELINHYAEEGTEVPTGYFAKGGSVKKKRFEEGGEIETGVKIMPAPKGSVDVEGNFLFPSNPSKNTMGIKLAKGGGSNQYGEPYGFDNDDDDFTAYYWKETQDKNGKITGYDVIEKDTQQIVYQTTSKQKALEYIDRNRYGYAKGGAIQEGDWVAGKKSTVRGKVYEEMGEFVKLEDKYGNKSNTMYSKKELKHSSQPRYAKGGIIGNNFQENLDELLKAEGWSISYYDKNINDVPKEKAYQISLSKFDPYYESIAIKLPSKMEVTFEWIMNKINKDKVYKSFSENFNKLLKTKGFGDINAYPTTYGIGVFVGFGSHISETKKNIENLLNSLGLIYTTEYSDAQYVFRYNISKSRENIEKIEQLDMKMAKGGVAKSGWKHRMKK